MTAWVSASVTVSRMKRFLLVVAAMLVMATAALAQPKAIGIRGGLFGLSVNGEISYEHWYTIFDNDYDFLEGEIGVIGGSGFKATGLYNFTLAQPDWTDGEWALYAGPGVTVGYGPYTDPNDPKSVSGSPFVGVVCQLGLEYTFPFPLQLSVDFRPNILLPARMISTAWYGLALSARYAF